MRRDRGARRLAAAPRGRRGPRRGRADRPPDRRACSPTAPTPTTSPSPCAAPTARRRCSPASSPASASRSPPRRGSRSPATSTGSAVLALLAIASGEGTAAEVGRVPARPRPGAALLGRLAGAPDAARPRSRPRRRRSSPGAAASATGASGSSTRSPRPGSDPARAGRGALPDRRRRSPSDPTCASGDRPLGRSRRRAARRRRDRRARSTRRTALGDHAPAARRAGRAPRTRPGAALARRRPRDASASSARTGCGRPGSDTCSSPGSPTGPSRARRPADPLLADDRRGALGLTARSDPAAEERYLFYSCVSRPERNPLPLLPGERRVGDAAPAEPLRRRGPGAARAGADGRRRSRTSSRPSSAPAPEPRTSSLAPRRRARRASSPAPWRRSAPAAPSTPRRSGCLRPILEAALAPVDAARAAVAAAAAPGPLSDPHVLAELADRQALRRLHPRGVRHLLLPLVRQPRARPAPARPRSRAARGRRPRPRGARASLREPPTGGRRPTPEDRRALGRGRARADPRGRDGARLGPGAGAGADPDRPLRRGARPLPAPRRARPAARCEPDPELLEASFGRARRRRLRRRRARRLLAARADRPDRRLRRRQGADPRLQALEQGDRGQAS